MIIKRLRNGLGMLVIRPNFSGNRINNSLATLIALAVLVLANLPFVLIGYWIPLVFSAIYLMALAAALVITYVSLDRQQVVYLKTSSILVEEGRHAPEQRWEYPREWVRMEVANLDSMTRLPDIRLVCSGKSMRLGYFLDKTELTRLIAILRKDVKVRV